MEQNHNRTYPQVIKEMWQTLFFFVVLIIGVAYYGGYLSPRYLVFRCDAEKKVTTGTIEQFMCNNHFFPGGKLQDSTLVHQGQYSIRIGGDAHKFAFDVKLPIEGGETIKVQLWKNGNGKDAKEGKVAFSVKNKLFWKTAERVVEKNDDGWEYIYEEFQIPKHVNNQELQVFCWNDGPHPIWMDDFVLEVIRP